MPKATSASAIADGSLSVGWAGWTSSRMTSVIRAAHQRRTRVVLTVQAFAWSAGQAETQSALLGSAAARQKLARQVAAAVRDRGADGVNLDFEPLVSGRADEFVALVRSIRSELNRIHKGYQLTFDTTGYIGNYPIEAATAPGGADAIFIMGYDYRTASAGSAGSIAPLGGPAYDLVDTILAFTDRVPPGKLILGIPYYGRAWSTVSGKPRARTQTGAKYGWSTSVTYANAVALAKQHRRQYDRRDASAWIAYKRRNCTKAHGCVTSWREVYYDDAQSLRAKYDTINRYGLRGAGIWALGYDDTRPELYKVIVAKFLHDTTPPETGIDVLAVRQPDEGFVVGWSALDMNPIRNYDVQVSTDGGPWRAWLSKTRATDAVWLGRSGHAYAFRARATDAKGNRGRWDVTNLPSSRPTLHKGGFATVKTASLSVRSRPDTAGSVVSQLHRGDIVAITGGPVAADGYTWFKISGPLETWAPAEPVRGDVWVAGRQGTTTFLGPRTAPNTTIVAAGLARLTFGAGGPASIGASQAATAARAFSPNGDGSEDRLTLRWTNGLAFDSLMLRVFRSNGSLVGTRAVTATGSGARAWAWDGSVGGHRLADGRYAVQLVGRAGGRTYTAPSVRPLLPAQVTAYAITIDTVRPKLTGAAIGGRLISPPRDGRHDAVRLAGSSTGATRWRVTAALVSGGMPGAPIRTLGGTGGRPRTSWDGRTDTGRPAADGRYRLTLAVLDPAGNFAARSWDVTVDGTPPTLATSAEPVVDLAERRRHRRCRGDPLGRGGAGDGVAPDRARHPARAHPRGSRRRHGRHGPLGRPRAGGAEAGRWRLPAPDLGPGRGREPAQPARPDPGRPDRRLAALGAERVLPAGPRHACPNGPRDVQARPRGDDLARGRQRQGGCRPVRMVRPPPDGRTGRLDLGWPDGERVDGRSGHVPHRPDRAERRRLDHAPAADRRRCVRDRHLVDAAEAGPPPGRHDPIDRGAVEPTRGDARPDRPPAGPPVRHAGRPRPVHGPVHGGSDRQRTGLDQGQRHGSRRPTERVGPLADGPLSVAEGPASPVHCSG